MTKRALFVYDQLIRTIDVASILIGAVVEYAIHHLLDEVKIRLLNYKRKPRRYGVWFGFSARQIIKYSIPFHHIMYVYPTPIDFFDHANNTYVFRPFITLLKILYNCRMMKGQRKFDEEIVMWI